MKEMSAMPNRLMRESQFDEIVKDVSQDLKQPIADIRATAKEASSSLSLSAWANPDARKPEATEGLVDQEIEERKIAPPGHLEDQDTRPENEQSSDNADLNHA
jgi:hypothetical protein